MALGTPVEFHDNSGASIVTSQTVTLPASIANGSAAFMLVGLNSAQASNTVATPAGWTLLAGPNDMPTFGNELTYLFGRAVGAAQQGSTVTLAVTGAGVRIAAQGIVIPGASATPDVAAAEFRGASESSTTLTAPTQTPATANAMQVILMFRRFAAGTTPLTTTPPSGFTELVDDATTKTTNTTGSLFGAWGAYRQLTGQAGTAQGTKTITLDAASNGHGYIFTVKPTPVVGSPTASAGTSDAVKIDATGSAPAGGGALSYSISQASGPAATPSLLSAGVWSVDRHATTDRVYTITVTEAGGGSDTATATVTGGASGSGGDNVQERVRVSGAWV